MSRWVPTSFALHDATPDHASAWHPRQPMVGAVLVSADEKNVMQSAINAMSSDVAIASKNQIASFATNYANISAMNACAYAGYAWDHINQKCTDPPVPDPEKKTYPKKGTSAGDLSLVKFEDVRWTPFVLDWNAFAIGSGWMFNTDDFEKLAIRYGQLREEWTKELKQKTDAPAINPSTSSVADELGKGAKDAAGKVGGAAVYGLAGLGGLLTIGLVVLGVIYVGPIVAPLLKRGK